MKFANWHGDIGKVVSEAVGYVVVEFPDKERFRILRGIPGLTLFEQRGRGRPRRHTDNASRQRAYRQRKAGKALRKYERKEAAK